MWCGDIFLDERKVIIMKILNKIRNNVKRILELLECSLVFDINDYNFKTEIRSYKRNMHY